MSVYNTAIHYILELADCVETPSTMVPQFQYGYRLNFANSVETAKSNIIVSAQVQDSKGRKES